MSTISQIQSSFAEKWIEKKIQLNFSFCAIEKLCWWTRRREL